MKPCADAIPACFQEAINNIDKLTSVARQLSTSKMDFAKAAPIPGAAVLSMPMQSSTGGAPSSPSTSLISLRVQYDKTQPGDTVVAMGSGPLGDWQPSRALKLRTSSATWPYWEGTVTVPRGTKIEFKYVVARSNGELMWESLPGGKNRVIDAQYAGWKFDSRWGAADSGMPIGDGGSAVSSRQASPARRAGHATVQGGTPISVHAQTLPAPAAGDMAKVHFRIKCQTQHGENVAVCGSVGTFWLTAYFFLRGEMRVYVSVCMYYGAQRRHG